MLDNTNIFHVGSLSLTDQPARDTTFYAVKRAKKKGSIISYDPNYRASLWKDEETAKATYEKPYSICGFNENIG